MQSLHQKTVFKKLMFRNCSVISEGSLKKSHYFCHFWIILVFLWRESAKSVLWCSRSKIHLSDAPNELCRIPMCYATSQRATPHPNELRHTPMCYATSQWATPHPNELRHTPMSYATSQWAAPHSNELGHTPMSYATSKWATPHSYELRHTAVSIRITHYDS